MLIENEYSLFFETVGQIEVGLATGIKPDKVSPDFKESGGIGNRNMHFFYIVFPLEIALNVEPTILDHWENNTDVIVSLPGLNDRREFARIIGFDEPEDSSLCGKGKKSIRIFIECDKKMLNSW